MKAIFINGSPRKNWNTDLLLKEAMRGAAEAGAETELVQLADLEFKGCRSCFACKLKESTTNGVCAVRDALHPVLERIMDADVLVLGSPIYFGNLTADTLALLERILFPVLNYKPPVDGKRSRTLPKTKQVGLVLTMNCGEAGLDRVGYRERFSGVGGMLSGLLSDDECRILYSTDTLQFTDYSKYDVTMFDPEAKKARRETQFPVDLENAYKLGKELTDCVAGR